MAIEHFLSESTRQHWSQLQQTCRQHKNDRHALFELANFLSLQAQSAAFGSEAAQALAGAAISSYQDLLDAQPDHALALNNLGSLHLFLNQPHQAETLFSQAIAIDSMQAHAHANLGIILSQQQRISEAIASTEKALMLNEKLPAAWNNLALLYGMAGHADKGVQAAERAIALSPEHTEWHDNRLLLMIYAGIDGPHKYQAQHAFKTLLDQNVSQTLPHLNTPAPERKLRIGYVSGDFRLHAASYFTDGLFREHQREEFENFFYYTGDHVDALTRHYHAQYADHWHNVRGLPSEILAGLIRQDQIDIIVDLSGHTQFNALAALARKPAPVIVSWLGYPDNIDLPAFDCRITDPVADPSTHGKTGFSAPEKLYRLEGPFCSYTPFLSHPERHHDSHYDVRDCPALQTGIVTFGSASNIIRLTDATIKLWSQAVQSCPGARLLLDSPGLDEAAIQEDLCQRFAATGLPADQLCFVPRDSQQQYLIYHQIDIALDPYPCNAGTTTCDALWMGVPVISLSGNTFASRIGRSMLTYVGHPEWACHTETQFIEQARTLATNLSRLNALRHALRPRMRDSLLLDAGHFAKQFTQALRKLWQRWTESPQAEAARTHAHLQESLQLSASLMAQGEYAVASDAYRSILAHWPDNGEALFGFGMALMLLNQDTRSVRAILERAAHALHQQGQVSLLADCLATLGNACVQDQDLTTAAHYFANSLALKDSDQVRAWQAEIHASSR